MIRESVSILGDIPTSSEPPASPSPPSGVAERGRPERVSLQEARDGLAATPEPPAPEPVIETRTGCRWGHKKWWKNDGGRWVCGDCHPPARPDRVEWHHGVYPG